MAMADRAPNPYPGPRPFQRDEKLYGRDREITQLFYLLSSERVVLLHSPSGAGKSSLLNAGLVPRLRRERFDVWPTVRLSAPVAGYGNRFVASAVSSLEEGLPERRRRSAATIAGQTLDEYVCARPRRPEAPGSVVLLFDQFEEILTLDPLSVEPKQEFFRQVGEALKNPDVFALFAIREDYLAPLDPYRDDVPTRLSNAFRIDLLTRDAAKDAITKPAADAGRAFSGEAADKLTDDLAEVSVQQPDGSFRKVTGRYVEPVQLQVVCRRLWDALPDDIRTIGVEHLRAAGDVNKALAAYYNICVGQIAGADSSYERRLREWFNEKLITPGGKRVQVLREEDKSGDLDNASIARLLDTHLVRSDQRSGATWYELAHDRLIEPVRTSNAAWRSNLSLLQRQAELWGRERPESLLLRGRDLKTAEDWARDHAASVLPVEKDLLDRSVRQRRATWIKLGALALAICVLAIGLLMTNEARRQAREAQAKWEDLYKRAKADNLAFISSQSLTAGDLTRAADAAEAAYEVYPVRLLPSVERALSNAYAKATVEHMVFYKTVFRHNEGVVFITYSPDGSKLLTTSNDGTAKLWDRNGELIREMKHLNEQGAPQKIKHAAFTHGGDKIITVGYGHLVKMWDSKGRYLKDLIGHGCSPDHNFCEVNHVAISPDDETFVTVSADQNVIMWNSRGDKRKILDEHEINGNVITVVFSPDGKYFATAGAGWVHTVQLYKVSGDRIASLSRDNCTEQDKCGIFDVAFDPAGKFLLTASADTTIKMYDLAGKVLKTLTNHSGRVRSVVFAPDGQFLSASEDKTAILWNQDGSVRTIFKGHKDPVTKAVFSPDGKYIATSSSDKTARLWDPDGNVIAIYAGHEAGVDQVQFSPDGRYIATASQDKTARLWGLKAQPAPILKHDGEVVVSARFVPGGNRMLTASNDPDTYHNPAAKDPMVRLWNADDTSKPLKTYEKVFGFGRYYNRSIYSLDVSPDGARFITTGTDYTVRIWDVESGRVVNKWIDDRDNCNSTGWCGATNARYSPDGKYIVTSGFGGMIKIFDSAGAFVKKFKDDNEVHAIAISRDNTRIVTGSHDGTIKLWDFVTAKLENTLIGHAKPVESVNISDTGDRIVSGSDDQTVKLWDLQGKIILDITDHAGEVTSVAFSPSMKQIVSSSFDKTAKIWDLKGNLVTSLTGHQKYLQSAYFSPSGDKVITASGDGTARVWPSADWIHNWIARADIYHLTDDDRKKLGMTDEE
jgi:WD40 repeat protein